MSESEKHKWMVLEALMGCVKCGIKVYAEYRKIDGRDRIEAARYTLDNMGKIAEIDFVVYKTVFKWNEDIFAEMLSLFCY